ncbi:FitA-like ribbon-helix-helix domain-containing protein [Streptomyces sp. NBC_01485]|uniref:FitA-like ribbon-helix-helix domain-containing protein n=1 Tax=Streptomyces sp. NBC_01485 TaxID=2903884 RepID=UPI002E31AA14|nr:toxin-antitoxin system HicB family antitoxin [Streptomyces sp. NBC_01485]
MVKLNLRLPDALHARLTARAAADRRSLNAEILHFIEVALGSPVVDSESPGGDSASPAPLRGKPDSSPA